MAKNCHTCKNLQWHDDDGAAPYQGDSGFGCDKRDEGGESRALLTRLEDQIYRNRPKRCFEEKWNQQ